jgi:pimeloyl-ACP methyl ester carboxylesterase/DNA-binding CsgD family transcriptional regulator
VTAPSRVLQQQIRFCKSVDGVRLAYATAGKGPPLVKASNWMSHLEFDWRSPVWRPFLEGLAARYTVIRYDERGSGLSDWNAGDLSFESWVRDLESVVDVVGLTRFPLLGISQGGPIAIAYAVRHPERVSHLILYGAYARGRFKRDPTPLQSEEARTLLNLIRIGWGRENPAFRQVFTSLFIPDGTFEQFRWFNELHQVSSSPENAARLAEEFSGIDVTELAPQVSVPTIVLHRRHDSAVPFEEGRLMAGLIPNARFVPLDGRNHLLLGGEPALDQFFAEVDGFLSTDLSTDDAGTPARPVEPPRLADLTAREAEVLDLVARGLDNTEIAARLGVSVKTLRNHITSIFSKLNVGSRAQAIVRARDAGLGQG